MSRVGTNLTLEIQSRTLLLLTSLFTPDEAGGFRSLPNFRRGQVTQRESTFVSNADSTCAFALCAAISSSGVLIYAASCLDPVCVHA